MKKFKNLAITLTLAFMMAGSGALAQDPPMNMRDDDLGIDDHLQLEKPAKKVVTKEDVEPLIEMVCKGRLLRNGDFVGDGDEMKGLPTRSAWTIITWPRPKSRKSFRAGDGYSPIKKYNAPWPLTRAPVVYVSFRQ
ncbi:MAG: hypothetical protein HS130_08360 [Deltaproteobacteria bacterium]|nr:hypothetical protein [Deltaproteobacteria bacterium]